MELTMKFFNLSILEPKILLKIVHNLLINAMEFVKLLDLFKLLISMIH